MGIEETLLEYHQATNLNWSYTIRCVKKLPDASIHINEVSINNTYVKFWVLHLQNESSVIEWMFDNENKPLF